MYLLCHIALIRLTYVRKEKLIFLKSGVKFRLSFTEKGYDVWRTFCLKLEISMLLLSHEEFFKQTHLTGKRIKFTQPGPEVIKRFSYSYSNGLFPHSQHSEIFNFHLANILISTPEWSGRYSLFSHVNVFIINYLRIVWRKQINDSILKMINCIYLFKELPAILNKRILLLIFIETHLFKEAIILPIIKINK